MSSNGSLAGKKVLVTGASGFIGSHLCRRLLGVGAEVHAVSRSSPGIREDMIHWSQMDAGDMGAVRGNVQTIRPDFVFHLASHVKGSHELQHVLPTFHSNLQTTVNLLTAVAEIGCTRIVLAGSLAEPELEKGEEFPSSPYAAAKWAGSAYARMFHALYGVPVVLARIFMVYGPGQKDITKLIPYVILSLLQEKAPQITSGTRLVDWIYVGDVVDGLLDIAGTSGLEGTTIELGSGELVSIREIVERIERLIGARAKVLHGALPDRPMEPVRVADVTRTRERTGWKPSTSLEAGLRQTIEWYRSHLHEVR